MNLPASVLYPLHAAEAELSLSPPGFLAAVMLKLIVLPLQMNTGLKELVFRGRLMRN
jgi:hypothetical protein